MGRSSSSSLSMQHCPVQPCKQRQTVRLMPALGQVLLQAAPPPRQQQ